MPLYMENKILIFGIMFMLVLFVLGCTEEQEVNTPDTDMGTGDGSQETVAETISEEAPVYLAPLTGVIDKKCTTDEDCMLIQYKTGSGIREDCMGPASDYEGIATDDCYCKNIDQITQTFSNGTEITTQIYECRHI